MKITDDIINHLAHLARLSFSDEEKANLKQDLEKMTGFVEKLKEINTTGVEPLLHITDAESVLREDEVNQTITKEEALLNAPHTNGNFFIVPKVIKKDSN
jgi:aspartyl-tRNA(Asn)/glutamyl-tRNA(Gln) amidotransferase subunit C